MKKNLKIDFTAWPPRHLEVWKKNLPQNVANAISR
jgi:hypothetical protein